MHFQPRWVSRTRMLDRFRNPFCHLVSFMMWNHAYDKPLCEYNFVGTSDNKSKTDILLVTHWGLNKMAAALQTTYIQTHFLERYFSIMIQASCRSNALVQLMVPTLFINAYICRQTSVSSGHTYQYMKLCQSHHHVSATHLVIMRIWNIGMRCTSFHILIWQLWYNSVLKSSMMTSWPCTLPALLTIWVGMHV